MARRNRANKNRGREFENRVAKALGWTRVPYSGAQSGWGKGDVVDRFYEKDGEWQGECKTMAGAKTGLSINGKWLKQMNNCVEPRRPVMFFTRKASTNVWVLLPFVSWGHFTGIKPSARAYLSHTLKATEKGTFFIPQGLLDIVASGNVAGHIVTEPDTYYLITLDEFKEGLS